MLAEAARLEKTEKGCELRCILWLCVISRGRAGGPGLQQRCVQGTQEGWHSAAGTQWQGARQRCLGSEGAEPAVGRQRTPLPSSRGWLGSYVLGGLGTQQVPGSRMRNEGQDRQLGLPEAKNEAGPRQAQVTAGCLPASA